MSGIVVVSIAHHLGNTLCNHILDKIHSNTNMFGPFIEHLSFSQMYDTLAIIVHNNHLLL